MHYYSLNHQSPNATFEEATLSGQAPDKGLYFPEYIPTLPKGIIDHLSSFTKEELALIIMKPYVGESIPETTLKEITAETVNFDFPLVKITDDIFALELFHGPTLAFKDVGARFMSRCLGYFNRNSDKPTTVLVATSGDTGGAVANGFLGVDGVNVVILYPSGKVSNVQELQLTTLGGNITAIEINGTFDDCQRLVKQAFADSQLNGKLSLTSANSINIARWLPQQLYYFFALQQWHDPLAPVISVPSGNFGNICAGIVAHLSGLPVHHFIAACNINDTVPQFLESGNYAPKKAVPTISNAMDVGDPSNFIRILELFEKKIERLKLVLSSISVDDQTTKRTISMVYEKYGYILDPHGAVGYHALRSYLNNHAKDKAKGIFLETAHPVKFPETVENATQTTIPIPEELVHLLERKKERLKMDPSFDTLKDWLLEK